MRAARVNQAPDARATAAGVTNFGSRAWAARRHVAQMQIWWAKATPATTGLVRQHLRQLPHRRVSAAGPHRIKVMLGRIKRPSPAQSGTRA